MFRDKGLSYEDLYRIGCSMKSLDSVSCNFPWGQNAYLNKNHCWVAPWTVLIWTEVME